MDVDLHWGNIDPAHLIEWMHVVSEQGGIISFCYGGYGQYYKIVAHYADHNIVVTAERPERLIRNANAKILGIHGGN